jgi:hypothetical protein
MVTENVPAKINTGYGIQWTSHDIKEEEKKKEEKYSFGKGWAVRERLPLRRWHRQICLTSDMRNCKCAPSISVSF